MIWLEMSHDRNHGGLNWEFSKCLWSPAHKKSINNSNLHWAFWESILRVKQGEIVFHLTGRAKTAAIVGMSIAATDGYQTKTKPTDPGIYVYDDLFYRVDLKDYKEFPIPILLTNLFIEKAELLENYFINNKNKPKDLKRSLFYVRQSNRLQCLNGAYLSEIEEELMGIIFGQPFVKKDSQDFNFENPDTDEVKREIQTRIGQQKFSELVKTNFKHKCCFPQCNVKDPRFLIGAHIARWSDIPELRGKINNGLCFCLLHDKAFELGYFTIDNEYKVIPNYHMTNISTSEVFKDLIERYKNEPIKPSNIVPSIKALEYHWNRFGYIFDSHGVQDSTDSST
ncbi:MAG: HNH endonuclease [Bacillota bacterium]